MAKSMNLRPDIESAAAKILSTFGSKRELRTLETNLWPDETVRAISSGTYGPGQGIVVLTDRRVIFWKNGFTKQLLEDFPLKNISSVQWESGMMLGKLHVYTSGNKATIANMDKDGGRQISELIRYELSN